MTQDDNKNTSKPEILLVDDHELNREVFSEVLARNFRVHVASGVDGAMKILREHPHIAAVMTDYNMPRKTGLQLLQEMREEEMNQSVVLFTARMTLSYAAWLLPRKLN